MIPLLGNLWLALSLALFMTSNSTKWGFYGHQIINRTAVFCLPLEMIGFYKTHIDYLTERSVNPYKRRYIDDKEAPRHFIDLDYYGENALNILPRNWNRAVEIYGDSVLMSHGIVSWHLLTVKNYLTLAFKNQDLAKVLRYSADLCHYVADAHVPLHTTQNYNGQFTNQIGIHGFWETRLPELFANEYNLFVGSAGYIYNVQEAAWNAVASAHLALDYVLIFENELTGRFPDSKKYSFEARGNQTVRVYAYDFSLNYHRRLNGMVERQMRAAIKLTADL